MKALFVVILASLVAGCAAEIAPPIRSEEARLVNDDPAPSDEGDDAHPSAPDDLRGPARSGARDGTDVEGPSPIPWVPHAPPAPGRDRGAR